MVPVPQTRPVLHTPELRACRKSQTALTEAPGFEVSSDGGKHPGGPPWWSSSGPGGWFSSRAVAYTIEARAYSLCRIAALSY